MKRLLLAAALAALCASPLRAAWWLENDYIFGSKGVGRDSLSVFRRHSAALASGLNASYFRDNGAYEDRVWSVRAPVIYTTPGALVTFKPFLYPYSPKTGSSAYGAKAAVATALGEEADDSFLHLVLSAAAARQRAYSGTARRSFTQAAFEAQLEKSYYGQFYLLASAAAFTKPAGVSNRALSAPALDHGDLAFLGTWRQVTELPDWSAGVQLARNLRPEYDSHIYAGYSRISLRRAGKANSWLTGLKLGLNEKSTLDLGYNALKAESARWTNYYRLLLQLYF